MEMTNSKTFVAIVSLFLVTALVFFNSYELDHAYPTLKGKDYRANFEANDTSFDSEDAFFRYIERRMLHGPYSGLSTVDADFNVDSQPKYRGSDHLCRAPTKPMKCSSKSCIKISAVGLCGGWSTKLRKLPASFQCPNRKNTQVVIEHTDKPETIGSSNILLFTFVAGYLNMNVWLKLRQYRPPGQMWVVQTEESPYYAVGPVPPWMFRTDTYNISNTYRRNADISSPYGYYEPHRSEEPHETVDFDAIYSGRPNFMLWISSHCETLQWDRTKFVKDLQKVMKVDIFGRCGKNTLCQQRWNNDCTKEVDDLIRSYKFYLAIENSCCEDYITEKLWHAYSIGTIPVVIGPRIDNYNKLAPPGSFIHMDQFESADALKNYLEYLSGNATAYAEYFRWRTQGVIREHSMADHYKNHLSNSVLCSIVDQYFYRKSVPADTTKMFDAYGPEWRGSCHSCATNQWIRDYEYSIEHGRKSKSLWAK